MWSSCLLEKRPKARERRCYLLKDKETEKDSSLLEKAVEWNKENMYQKDK